MEELVKSIIEDGLVDVNEVKQLEESFFEDGVIDKDEAEALFEINDAVSGEDNAPEYEPFFIKCISSYLKDKDQDTISKESGDWLAARIGADGQVDKVEKALLLTLSSQFKAIESSELNDIISATFTNS